MHKLPDLKDVIQDHIQDALINLRVSQPGRIESYDSAKGTVEVTPLLRVPEFQRDATVQWVGLPRLPSVPILYMHAGGRRIKVPITVGDIVLLIWCDFNIDDWKAGAGADNSIGLVTPKYYPGHSLPDAIAIPGLLNPLNKNAIHEDIAIASNGTVSIGEGADASILRGEDTKAWADVHLHTFVGVPPGVTSITGVPQSPLPTSALATKGKVK